MRFINRKPIREPQRLTNLKPPNKPTVYYNWANMKPPHHISSPPAAPQSPAFNPTNPNQPKPTCPQVRKPQAQNPKMIPNTPQPPAPITALLLPRLAPLSYLAQTFLKSSNTPLTLFLTSLHDLTSHHSTATLKTQTQSSITKSFL